MWSPNRVVTPQARTYLRTHDWIYDKQPKYICFPFLAADGEFSP